MTRSVERSALVILLTAAAISWSAPVTPAQPGKSRDEPLARKARELRQKLAQPASLEKGIDASTPLKDAMDFLENRYDMTIVVDNQAFSEDLGTENVEEQPVRLPKMVGVRLATVLRMLAAQVRGTYLVLPDHVLITTRQRANPAGWTAERHAVPLVDAEFDRRPLSEALSELSSMTGINILLDSRVGEQVKAPVTASLSNAPVDTAVRLLADMAGLRAVTLDGALYITDPDKAEQLEKEQASRRAMISAPAPMPAVEQAKQPPKADAKPVAAPKKDP